MCGIFGYIGHKTSASNIVFDGLKRLDYRGYDSWGIAVCKDKNLFIKKDIGKISEVQNTSLPKSYSAIAHTRWATTGKVSVVNAHPHLASDGSFALAQNGIVENYLEIKKDLEKKGHIFISETDTEVIVRLIEEKNKTYNSIFESAKSAFKELKGRNTFIILTKDNNIIAAKNGSPLVIGVDTKSDDIYLSSDTASFSNLVHKIIVIDNGQIVKINKEIDIYDVISGRKIKNTFEELRISEHTEGKNKFKHYMLKEIFDTPIALDNLIKSKDNDYKSLVSAIKRSSVIYTIGSGSAGIAASQVAFYLRDIAKINAISLIGADSIEYTDLFTKKDLIIAISQSGETADVLEVLEKAKKKHVPIASFVNMPGSMMTRLSDYKFMAQSGPEMCVMSTKTFTTQIAFGFLLAKSVINKDKSGKILLSRLSKTIRSYLKDEKNHKTLNNISKILTNKKSVFLLGKYQNFNIAKEGMVKLIEGAYIHGHALPAGDLKHYVITLMEKGVPVIALMSNDKVKIDIQNAISEVKLRGAEVIGISPENNSNFDYHITVPDIKEVGSIINLIPLQLLAYYLALRLGNNIDKPRNIAKSVTVK